jgi:hypothetical protein
MVKLLTIANKELTKSPGHFESKQGIGTLLVIFVFQLSAFCPKV